MNITEAGVRFFPAVDPQVSSMISRDLDSKITAREVAAVEEWLSSDRAIHSMRGVIYSRDQSSY